MDILSEMRSAIQSGLNVSSTSSLFPSDTIDAALNRVYIKVGGLFRWPALEYAKKTSAVKDQEYYDAPDIWRPDSMFRLEIDDERYGNEPDGSPMDFGDYLTWKLENEGSTEKKWAVQWLRYFIYPTPTANGDNNISVWGQKNVTELSEDGDVTIFSYSMPECNEALVLETVAVLKKKGELEKSGQMYSAEALQTLTVAYNKIRQEKAKYEKQLPFLYVDDFFGSGVKKQVTGNF